MFKDWEQPRGGMACYEPCSRSESVAVESCQVSMLLTAGMFERRSEWVKSMAAPPRQNESQNNIVYCWSKKYRVECSFKLIVYEGKSICIHESLSHKQQCFKRNGLIYF